MTQPTIGYFRDDHGRTLRVHVTDNMSISLALIDNKTGNAVYFDKHPNPKEGNNTEDCTSLSQLKFMAQKCPLHIDNH